MKIFRVENDKNKGPYHYCDYDFYDEMLNDHHDGDHPVPMRIHFLSEYYKCAFESMDDLEHWFGEYLFRLIDVGFNIVQIEIEDEYVKSSHRQCLFDSTKIISSMILSSCLIEK